MNNPTSTTPTTSTSTTNASAPKTDQNNPVPQTDPAPIAVGGDLKKETKNEVVKENKDITAV